MESMEGPEKKIKNRTAVLSMYIEELKVGSWSIKCIYTCVHSKTHNIQMMDVPQMLTDE